MRAHILVELPIKTIEVRQIIGACKAKSSLAVRKQFPGRVWAARGKYLPVKDREHLIDAFKYIRGKQAPGAWSGPTPESRTRRAGAEQGAKRSGGPEPIAQRDPGLRFRFAPGLALARRVCPVSGETVFGKCTVFVISCGDE